MEAKPVNARNIEMLLRNARVLGTGFFLLGIAITLFQG
jgi:hypothetical protein